MQFFVVQLYMSALAQNKCQSYIDKSQQTQPPRQEVGSSAHPYYTVRFALRMHGKAKLLASTSNAGLLDSDVYPTPSHPRTGSPQHAPPVRQHPPTHAPRYPRKQLLLEARFSD